MSERFLRCFCYGLEPGETVHAQVEGQLVTFSYETPQVDVQFPPAETQPANPPINE